MLSVLILGLLLGLQHATEADHLAAVASLTTRGTSLRDAARQGAAWGVGHGLTLLLFGGVVLLIDGIVGPQISQLLEGAVGLMLVLLGLDVLMRLWRARVHFHVGFHNLWYRNLAEAEQFLQQNLDALETTAVVQALSYTATGFVEEGRLRQAKFLNGKYQDIVLMSVLRDEWQAEN